MNQILVTEKLFITPELKRKKKMYKIKFFVSIFAICLLCSYYIYAEYHKGKSEEVSKSILLQLANMASEENVEDDTVRNIVNDVLIVALDKDTSEIKVNEVSEPEVSEENNTTGTVVAEDGTEYTTESILTIPLLDISYPVFSDTSEELLKISLNKYWGPEPNKVGNYCIVGHNYKSGKMFGKLSQMEIGDTATLTDMKNKSITYEVYEKYIVDPTDVSCTSQLTGGTRQLTLITCSNYGTQRLVVKCREI